MIEELHQRPNTLWAVLAFVVSVVVIVILERLVGDVPTWLGAGVMGIIYTLILAGWVRSDFKPENT